MSMSQGEAARRAGMPAATDRGGVRNTPGRQLDASKATVVTERSAPAGNSRDNDPADLMQRIVESGNMQAAFRAVKRNGGAPGVDNMTVEALASWLREHWPQTKADLLAGRYEPQAVRRVDIAKPGGGERMLGIPTVRDRLIQQAIHQVLAPLWEGSFSEHSYGFRPGRSAHQAVQAAREHVEAGHRWVVDLDLEKFFDRVNHDILMARVARRVKDKPLLRLIRRCLEAGMMLGGIVEPRTEGTPQGGPLSPLLSNILLDDLDKELERRGHRFVRYADDCNIYVKSKVAGERVLGSVSRFVGKKLRLKVNEAKSAVERPWKRKFLGYSLTHHHKPRLKAAGQSVARLREKVRALCRQGRGRNLRHFIQEDLNPLLRGWGNYYRLAEVRGIFEELDMWVRRKLRCLKWRQWKRGRTRAEQLQKLGLNKQRAVESAFNGRGPWWNAGARHMNAALPAAWFTQRGLVSLIQLIQRYQRA